MSGKKLILPGATPMRVAHLFIMELTYKKVLLHLGLFLITFVTTTFAGSEWVYGKSVLVAGYGWQDFFIS